LGGLLLDEGALDRRRMIRRPQTFECRHLLALQEQQRRDAGEHGLAVDHHRAGAALPETAAVFGGVELEVVAQDIEQGRIRLGGDFVVATIDLQFHGWPRWEEPSRMFGDSADFWRAAACACRASATVCSTLLHAGDLLKRARR